MNWTPTQVIGGLGALGDHTDGFCISMNTLCNTFGLAGNISVNNGGIPIAAPPVASLFQHVNAGLSGSQNGIPDGLTRAFERFANMYVVGGVYEITVSQDTPGTGDTMGSTRFAVCGFCTGAAMSSIGPITVGHNVYPTTTSGGASNEASFAGLLAEPNVKHSGLTPFAGSRTEAKIRYPFRIAKFARPDFMASASFYQNSANAAGSGNPNYSVGQPFLLVQFISDGTQPQTFRVEQKISWYVYAYDRKPLVSMP